MPLAIPVKKAPLPIKYVPVILPTALTVPKEATLPASTFPVATLPPVIFPVVDITPLVKTFPPVILLVVVTGPVKLARLPVYVGK